MNTTTDRTFDQTLDDALDNLHRVRRGVSRGVSFVEVFYLGRPVVYSEEIAALVPTWGDMTDRMLVKAVAAAVWAGREGAARDVAERIVEREREG